MATRPLHPVERVYLIGYRGAGKSTIAPLVAAELGGDWHAIDLDARIEKRAGRTVRAIFHELGEPAFRDLEEGLLAETVLEPRAIIATGGGAVLRPANQRALQSGVIVLLTAPVEILIERLLSNPAALANRPNLTSFGGDREIRTVFADRAPIYAALADLTIDTTEQTPFEAARTIARFLAAARPERIA
jgi:shikimate kinase